MPQAYALKEGVIVLNRELTELDLFVKGFLDVIIKQTNYLIVSGYISIATGRTRGTEDVDMLIPFLSEAAFHDLFEDLKKAGFWCYQGDTATEVYPYIRDELHIRFARTQEMFPNIELIPVDKAKKVQYFELSNPQKMRIKDFEFNAPPVEFEILYKERILGSPKDIADALHLRTLFSELLSEEKFKRFEAIIGPG